MLHAVVKSPLSNSLLDGRFIPQRDRDYTPMQKLSLLVAASVIALGSAYSAMAQTPGSAASKPGAKATIQAPALVSAKGNLSSFAVVAPAAQARSAKTSVGAMASVASAQAMTSATGGKLSALAAPAAASTAKSSVGKANLSAAINATSSAAAAKAGLNLTASGAAMKAKSNLGSMARVTSRSQASALTKRANLNALAKRPPTPAAMVNKSNFSAYAK